MAARVTAFEAKTRFGELLQRVENGEEIVITRHDRPVARVVRERAPNLETIQRSVESLRQLQQRIRKRSRGRSDLSAADVRAAIARGRNYGTPVAIGAIHAFDAVLRNPELGTRHKEQAQDRVRPQR